MIPGNVGLQDRTQMGLDLNASAQQQQQFGYGYNKQPSDAMTPVGIYSDSEITMRPVFGNRPLYAHPINITSEQQRQRFQHLQLPQQHRSTEDLSYGRATRRASQFQETHSESETFPVSRNTAATNVKHHHHRAYHHQRTSVDYRELKNTEDEDDGTEYEEQSDEPRARNGSERKHSDSNGGRRESVSKNDHHHHHHHHHRQSSTHRRNSRHGSRDYTNRKQQQSTGGNGSGVGGGADSELGDESETESSASKLSSQSAFTGRPKGSRTLK